MKTTTLRPIGTSQGVILDKTVLDLVNSKELGTIFKITLKGPAIILTPVTEKDIEEAALEASERISDTHREVLDKLAK